MTEYACAYGCGFATVDDDDMNDHYDAEHRDEEIEPEGDKDYFAMAMASSLAFAEYAEMAFNAFIFAYSTIPDYRRRGIENAYSAIAGALSAQTAEAYKRVFMWSTVSMDEEIRAKAKELAMRKFLTDHSHIMHFMSENGETPGSWLSDDEKGFRDQIATVMKLEKTNAEDD